MTATAGMIAELRRLTAEPTTAVYTDDALKAKIEAYPLADGNNNEPDAEGWLPTYDLAAAASDVWMEKAAGLAGKFDFSADGGSYSRSQAYEMARKQAAFFLSRRRVKSVIVQKWPSEGSAEE